MVFDSRGETNLPVFALALGKDGGVCLRQTPPARLEEYNDGTEVFFKVLCITLSHTRRLNERSVRVSFWGINRLA